MTGLESDDTGRFFYEDGTNMTTEFWQNGYSKAKSKADSCFPVHAGVNRMYALACKSTYGHAICRTDAVSKYNLHASFRVQQHILYTALNIIEGKSGISGFHFAL